jgi:hypothetical protein
LRQVELEATWRPAKRFELGLRATWQAAQYHHFVVTEIVAGAPVTRDYSDRQLIRVPRLARDRAQHQAEPRPVLLETPFWSDPSWSMHESASRD